MFYKKKLKKEEIFSHFEVYDNIYSLHTLEHIQDISDFLTSLQKNTKSGTMIYFSVPNFESSARYTKDIFASDGEFIHVNDFPALAPHEHFWHFSVDTFKNLILTKLDNCRIIQIDTNSIWQEDEQIDIVLEII